MDILAILFLGYLEMRHQVWYIMGKPRYAKNKEWAGHRTDPGAPKPHKQARVQEPFDSWYKSKAMQTGGTGRKVS